MDFGGVLDSGVVVACSDINTATPTTITTAAAATATSNALFTAASEAVSDAETKQKWYGSVGFLKQERTSGANYATEDDMRGSKMAKTTAATLPRSSFVGSEPHQMLSFSSSSYYPHASFGGNPGYGVAGLSGGNMHGVMSGVKGPFTPSQWMELEHQALIYKYITANVPIPPYLLNPIKKAIESAALSTFGLRVNSLGWGGASGFHLGFSSNTDPEPGRCRRTDGKKWRCSRDAVADQKYCERHMNRGRHRSRKPVESPSGHPASGTTTTAAAKLMPGTSSTSSSAAAAAVAVSGGGASNSLAFSHHNQLSNLQLPAATNPSVSAHHLDSRSFLDKEYVGERYQDPTGLSITSPILKDRQYSSIPKDQNPYKESSTLKFGLVCSDSLLNPLCKGSSLVSCRNYGTSEVVSDRENKSQHPIRQFMDNWPKNQSDRSMVLWPEIDMQQQSDSTQLSISIPMATSDFTSSTSSPANEKLNACPLKLSREIEATQMRLGVGAVINEQNQRQGNWIPIPWESSMGGPLGEVLHGTNSMTSECKNPSALNLMTEGWNGSPKPASSPTGVLQKAVFYSISNSSAGSSPRAESNKNTNGASPSNEILGSTLMNPSLPTL